MSSSLGWRTESTFLPSKSKAIVVENSSINQLKNVISNLKSKNAASGEKDQKKKLQSSLKEAIKNGQKPKSSQSNEEYRIQKSLEAKAKLYDEMMNGKHSFAKNPTLVDFDRKKTSNEKDHSSSSQPEHSINTIYHENDNFGEEKAEGEDVDEEPHRGEEDPWRWSNGREETQEEWEQEKKAERDFKVLMDSRIQAEIKEGMRSDDAPSLSLGPISLKNTNTRNVSEARVKSAWERTLNSSAKVYLKELHRRTEEERAKSVLGKRGQGEDRGGQREENEKRDENAKRKRL